MRSKGKAPGLAGRRPTRVRPGEKSSEYKRLAIRLSLDTTNIYAEVDLTMKAKALGECSIPGDSRRHWRKEPGLMAFLRSL